MLPTGIEFAQQLTKIHHHADAAFKENPNQRVYKEDELIKLLQAYGWPQPDWLGYSKTIDNFIAEIVSDELISHPCDTILDCMTKGNMTVIDLVSKMYPGEEQNLDNAAKVAAVLSGKARVTAKLAERLEVALGVDSRFWITRQRRYDEKLVKAAASIRPNPFA